MKYMQKNIINNLTFFLLIYLCVGISVLRAEKYEEIKVTGNNRLSVETILMFSGLKTDIDEYNNIYTTYLHILD